MSVRFWEQNEQQQPILRLSGPYDGNNVRMHAGSPVSSGNRRALFSAVDVDRPWARNVGSSDETWCRKAQQSSRKTKSLWVSLQHLLEFGPLQCQPCRCAL